MTDFSPALHRFGDVAVRLSVELGRTDMPLRDVLALGQGSVVTLNRLTDELLDITANGKVVAQGEVIAQDGKFALRIVQLVGEEPAAGAPVPASMAAPMAPVDPVPAPEAPSPSFAEATPTPAPAAEAEADAPADVSVDELADALAEMPPPPEAEGDAS